MSTELVPFGKHKGRPVDALLDDREYLDWLLAQGWFQQRYGNLYQIVINNGQQANETPEHNAMQIKFLDLAYRIKFAYLAIGERFFAYSTNERIRQARPMREFLSAYKSAHTEYLAELAKWKHENFPDAIEDEMSTALSYAQAMAVNTNCQADWAREWDIYKAQISEHLGNLAALPAERRSEYDLKHAPKPPNSPTPGNPIKLPKLTLTVTRIWFCEAGGYVEEDLSQLFTADDPQFEADGVDVTYQAQWGVQMMGRDNGSERNASRLEICARIEGQYYASKGREWHQFYFSRSIEFPKLYLEYVVKIEIKPSVGDDYPAILRQMQRNKSKYLLVGQYCGIGATKEQFVKFFELQGIKVIFEADVEEAQLPPYDEVFNEIELPVFDSGY